MLEKIENLMDECDILMENIEKISIKNSSLEILDDIRERHPSFYEKEYMYQKYRKQFSKAYFSGSDWYVGDSYTEWFLNKTYNDEDKANFIICAMLQIFINSINKKF